MRRISPVLVLLLAAGCAQAGISDWLNPFGVFGGKRPAGGHSGSPAGVQHSPNSPGHRGTRQLYSASSSNGQAHAPSGSSHQLGSPPGHLDDGFKPSFPPGFANPPSHSPNLNPFATTAGHGSEILGKGPFLPSQLTTYHTPNPPPHTPLVKPAPAPAPGSMGPRPRGRFPFGGGKGRRPYNSGPPGPPHAAVDSGSSVPDGTGPVGPDGAPMAYSEFPGLASSMSANQAPEYEETPTTPPESAPQRQPRPSLFSRLTGRHHRPAGPPPSYAGQSGRPHQGHGHHEFNGRPHHGGPGAGGPPSGPPSGPDEPSFLDGSGPESQNPFANLGNNEQLSGLNGPPGGRPGSDIFYASSPGSNAPFAPPIPDQGPQGPSPFGSPSSGGSSPFGNSQSGGPSPFGNSQSGGPSPFGNSQSGGPAPFANPQSGRPYGGPGGPRPGPGGPSSLFGGPSESGPQGPPRGPPGPGGPGASNFFAPNGNDYPEQFQGGPRDVRQQPGQLSPGDYRPQPNGPPDTAGAEEQNPGFYGALHNENSNGPNGAQLSNFFNNQEGAQGGPGGPPSYDGPSGGVSPYLGNGGPGGVGISGGSPGIYSSGGNPGIYGGAAAPAGHGQPNFAQPGRPRKPPGRPSLFRNPLAAFHSAPSTMPAYGASPLVMAASGIKPTSLPVPKGSRLLRPFQRKSSGIIPLSSPRDPNYRPMRLGASTLNPVTAPYEPDTAASGGFHGGYGDVGLTSNGDRILYHVAGHQGPYSYRFGFDTGKGYNRIFRFEEKDGKGYVKGKYGFYDKSGKLNLINYQAHPQHGYHAERGHSHGYY